MEALSYKEFLEKMNVRDKNDKFIIHNEEFGKHYYQKNYPIHNIKTIVYQSIIQYFIDRGFKI